MPAVAAGPARSERHHAVPPAAHDQDASTTSSAAANRVTHMAWPPYAAPKAPSTQRNPNRPAQTARPARGNSDRQECAATLLGVWEKREGLDGAERRPMHGVQPSPNRTPRDRAPRSPVLRQPVNAKSRCIGNQARNAPPSRCHRAQAPLDPAWCSYSARPKPPETRRHTENRDTAVKPRHEPSPAPQLRHRPERACGARWSCGTTLVAPADRATESLPAVPGRSGASSSTLFPGRGLFGAGEPGDITTK